MSGRGSGRTTRQLLAAPKGAVFVAPGVHAQSYTQALARHLGRFDLKIVTPVWFTNRLWQGSNVPVVEDHDMWFHLEKRQKEMAIQCKLHLQGRRVAYITEVPEE